MEYKIVMPSGIVFDFSNMVGAGRLQAQEVEQALQQQGAVAEKAVCELRRSGFAKKHLSKDGTPEHVYFPRMPYIADGNPNTEQSIIKLMRYSKHLRSKDVVIFLGVPTWATRCCLMPLAVIIGIPVQHCAKASPAFIFPATILIRWTAIHCCSRCAVWLE